MYEEGTLRPPTAADMERQRLPLEVIRVTWGCGPSFHECGHEGHVYLDRQVSFEVADLLEMCGTYGIPVRARVVPDDYDGGLALDWSHLD